MIGSRGSVAPEPPPHCRGVLRSVLVMKGKPAPRKITRAPSLAYTSSPVSRFLSPTNSPDPPRARAFVSAAYLLVCSPICPQSGEFCFGAWRSKKRTQYLRLLHRRFQQVANSQAGHGIQGYGKITAFFRDIMAREEIKSYPLVQVCRAVWPEFWGLALSSLRWCKCSLVELILVALDFALACCVPPSAYRPSM